MAVAHRVVEGLRTAEHLAHVVQREVGGEPLEPGRVGRWVVAEDPHQRDQATASLDE